MTKADVDMMLDACRKMLDASGLTAVSVRQLGGCRMVRAHMLRAFRVREHANIRAVEWSPVTPNRLALYRSDGERHLLVAVVETCPVHGFEAEVADRSPIAFIAEGRGS